MKKFMSLLVAALFLVSTALLPAQAISLDTQSVEAEAQQIAAARINQYGSFTLYYVHLS